MTKVDGDWILENPEVNPWHLRVFSSNKLTCKLPAFDWLMVSDEARDRFAESLPNYVIAAMDNARHEYREKMDHTSDSYQPEANFLEYMLEAPAGYEFSTKVINPDAGDNEELDWNLAPVDHPRYDDEDAENEDTWICWMVARVDEKADKRGKVAAKNKKSKAMLAMERRKKIKQGTKMEDDEDL